MQNEVISDGLLMAKKQNSIKKRFYTSVRTVSTVLAPELTNRIRYFFRYKSICRLNHPKTLSEKLLWIKLKVYVNSPLIKICGDKYAVRQYLSKRGYGHILNDCYRVWTSDVEIDFDLLPNQFVLKPNYGSKKVLICTDKTKVDEKFLRAWCQDVLTDNYWKDHRNFDGDAFNKKIVCEKFMTDEKGNPPEDYKIYCFNGKPIAICCVLGRFSKEGKREVFMSPTWKPLSEYQEIPSKPLRLEEMVSIATSLSSPFPFVRIDLYEIGDRVIFGELTFSPSGCIGVHEVPIDGKPMGDYLNLPTRDTINYLLNYKESD